MAARAGMANLLLQLRTFTNAGSSEYVVDGVTYFTDQQLQDELDQDRTTWYDVTLIPVPRRISLSAVQWLDYNIPPEIGEWLEEDAVGGGWQVKDQNINFLTGGGVDYTANYLARVITLTVTANGASRFLDCRTYDLYKTAAGIWRQKAALEMRAIDWSSNAVSIKASQRYEHCMQMAAYYDAKQGLTTTRLVRTDEV